MLTYDPAKTYSFKTTAFPFTEAASVPATMSEAAVASAGIATAAELAKVPKSDSNVTWNSTALASINAEVDAAMNTAIPGSPTANSINERIATMDGLILGTILAGNHTAQSGDGYAYLGTNLGALGAGATALAPAATALSNVTWTDAKAAFVNAAIDSRQATVANLGNTVTMAAAFAAMAPLNVFSAEALANAPTGGAGGDSKEDIYTYFVAGTNPVPFRATTAGIQTAVGMAAADLDTQLDAILAAASPQGGIYTQTVTIKTTGGVAIPNATVAIYSGSVLIDSKTTIGTGVAQPTCNANPAYTLRVTATGYVSYSAALAVTGDATLAVIELAAITIAASTDPAKTTAYWTVFGNDSMPVGEDDVTATIWIIKMPDDKGNAYVDDPLTMSTTTNGILSATLFKGGTYQVALSDGREWVVEVPLKAGTTYKMPPIRVAEA